MKLELNLPEEEVRNIIVAWMEKTYSVKDGPLRHAPIHFTWYHDHSCHISVAPEVRRPEFEPEVAEGEPHPLGVGAEDIR